MHIVCSDLEGVFVPEVWINVAEKTGIPELRLTTRDISDYDVLMKQRLSILRENGLKLKNITDVIATMEPLEGALDFLDWLRAAAQLIVVSDTYAEFARPLMQKLGWPTLFCHSLTLDSDGGIADYRLRMQDGKRRTVQALHDLNYRVIAMGDSYNDIKMLQEADRGILFRPPDNVKNEFPEFQAVYEYRDLKAMMQEVLQS